MFDDVAAERLERLERGIRRRKWDSAVQAAILGRGVEDAPAAAPPRIAVEPPLADLLAERVELLESKFRRVEWEIRRLERRSGYRRRAVLVAAVSIAAALAWVGSGPLGGLMSFRPPLAASSGR